VQSDITEHWGSLAMPSVLAAAHELKAPLVLLRQLSYQMSAIGELNPHQQLVQERIRLTSERALRLVENITKTTRLDDAMFALEPLQAHSVWHEVTEEISPLAAQMKQKVELKVPRKPLLVLAHAELLSAILMGLCDNALSHNPSGSKIRLSVTKDKETVVFSVRDHGPRIDRKSFHHLESRLGVAPQPLGSRPNSSGLGLWIAGSFARAMSSTLSVTQHRSGGMTFSLHVPLSGQLSLL
jgi:two-component system sensor histidine kinase KdpD